MLTLCTKMCHTDEHELYLICLGEPTIEGIVKRASDLLPRHNPEPQDSVALLEKALSHDIPTKLTTSSVSMPLALLGPVLTDYLHSDTPLVPVMPSKNMTVVPPKRVSSVAP